MSIQVSVVWVAALAARVTRCPLHLHCTYKGCQSHARTSEKTAYAYDNGGACLRAILMGLGEAIQHFSNPVIPPLSGSQLASEYKVASHCASPLSWPVYTEIKRLLRDSRRKGRMPPISHGICDYLSSRLPPPEEVPPLFRLNDVGIFRRSRSSRVSLGLSPSRTVRIAFCPPPSLPRRELESSRVNPFHRSNACVLRCLRVIARNDNETENLAYSTFYGSFRTGKSNQDFECPREG